MGQLAQKLMGMIGGQNTPQLPVAGPPSPGQGVSPAAGQPGGPAAASTGAPSTTFTTAFAQYKAMGLDDQTAAILASQTASQPGVGTIAASGLADVGNEILEAKLRPELGGLITAHTGAGPAPGPLQIGEGPLPSPALQTSSIIAELL
jgi:hypothetical protein